MHYETVGDPQADPPYARRQGTICMFYVRKKYVMGLIEAMADWECSKFPVEASCEEEEDDDMVYTGQ